MEADEREKNIALADTSNYQRASNIIALRSFRFYKYISSSLSNQDSFIFLNKNFYILLGLNSLLK